MATLEKPHPLLQLQPGDVLSRVEFERRYAAMPHLKKAELIDGIHDRLVWWELRDDEYAEVPVTDGGFLESPGFPGLIIDTRALLAGDLATALAALK